MSKNPPSDLTLAAFRRDRYDVGDEEMSPATQMKDHLRHVIQHNRMLDAAMAELNNSNTGTNENLIAALDQELQRQQDLLVDLKKAFKHSDFQTTSETS